MSKSRSAYGKSLKGISSASAASGGDIATSVINAISNGSVSMANIDISGGTINNVTFGTDGPGPVTATTIVTGAPNGVGYDVTFYGDTIGEYANWIASLGLWAINGDTLVTGISDLGNIRISGNTITSTNLNGSIIIDPSGTGCLIVNSCIHQNSVSGNVSFNVVNGVFDAVSTGNSGLTSTSGEINLVSQEQSRFTSKNGDLILSSGSQKVTSTITNIGTGSSVLITTSSASNLEVGDVIKISGSNSTPNVNGDQTVTQVVDSLNFRITPLVPVTVLGNSGSFTKDADIYLNAFDNVNIPSQVKLTFGGDSNYINNSSSNLNVVSSGDILLSSSADVKIPVSVGLIFGSGKKIEADNTGLNVTSDGYLNIDSSIVTFTDPILKLDSATPVSNNSKDKGIEFNYFSGTPKLGWFGYDNSTNAFSFFTSAVNSGEIISGTLGDARFASGNFTSLNVTGGSIASPSLDTCNINCSGLLTLNGATGIKLNSPNVIVPEGSLLKFGETGSPVTSISKDVNGDLLISSQNKIFLTPSSAKDVILPSLSGLVLNGDNGSQYIKSVSSTEMRINSSSFLNLTQVSGGVRLTEGLPLIFNQDETTKFLGDSSGNLLVNSGNSINLLPGSGQVTLPVNKRIELGSATSYIGTTALNAIVLSTPGTFNASSGGSTSITSVSGNINLSPSGSVILPINKAVQFGNVTEFLGSDLTGKLFLSSNSGLDLTSNTSSINLSPSTFVNIPYSKPLQFGSSAETITGTSGNILVNSGNFKVTGNLTNIESVNVTFSDPVITLGQIGLDNKDRGIEYLYSNKRGYFGMDDTDKSFMYIPDATNTGEVISGALGNVKFAGGSFTGLNLNNGSITSANSVSSNSNLTLQPGAGSDLILNVDSGRNVSIPVNVDLLFGGETNKIYSDGTDLHIVDSLVVDGSTTVNGDLTVTGNINIAGGSTVNFTVQRFTVMGGGVQHPNSSSNATFISISSSGTASGTIPAAVLDGFIKNICISGIVNGGTFELLFPTGRLLDPGTGTTVAKKMIFDTPGQSVQLLWDNVGGFYIITQGGGELVLV